MSRTRLSKKDKDSITKDWLAHFPTLGIYKPMHLLNRLGPMVVGILLEVKSGNCDYTPSFHVHNLTKPFPVVSLGMHRTAALKSIPLARHSYSLESAANQVADLALVPFSGDVPVAQVVSAYKTYLLDPKHRLTCPPDLESMILIAGWSKSSELLVESMEFARQMFSGLTELIRKQLGDKWLDDIYQRALNPDELERTAKNQVEELKLGNLPTRTLLI